MLTLSVLEPVKTLFNQIFSTFATFGIFDLIDILLVATVFYNTVKFIRDTRAQLLMKGMVVLFVVWVLAQWCNFVSIKWMLAKVFDYALIAIILIFQPELRRALEKVGHSKLGVFGKGSGNDIESNKRCINAVCKAVNSMHEQKIGALIVFEGTTPLGEVINTGTRIDAEASEELIENIFYPKSPLHDGALIIRGDRLVSAGCILPLTSNDDLSKELGTRHRAAVGVSENSDAVVVVVSEETGKISMAINGRIKRDYNLITLREKLYNLSEAEESESGVFLRFFRKKSEQNKGEVKGYEKQ